MKAIAIVALVLAVIAVLGVGWLGVKQWPNGRGDDDQPPQGAGNDQDTAASEATPEAKLRAAELAEEALGGERTSAENLSTRGSWLIGFAGVVLALVVGFVGSTATTSSSGHRPSANLGSVGEPVFAGVALLAVICLLLAALTALRVVRPRKRMRLPRTLLNDLNDGALSVDGANTEIAKLRVRFYLAEADSNDDRGKKLQTALRLVVGGLLLVAGLAVILFGHQAKVW